MGIYLNPPNMTKEAWLDKHGTLLEKVPTKLPADKDTYIVCLVNNGPFTAAGVCFDAIELRDFSDPKDLRPKLWFLADRSELEDAGVKLP